MALSPRQLRLTRSRDFAPLKRLASEIRRRYTKIQVYRYQQNVRAIQDAPYDISLYRNLLEGALESPEVQATPFLANTRADAVNLYIRHDIDFKQCMDRMPLLVDIDKGLGVRSGVYFRADDSEYALPEHRELIQEYHRAGFEVGLHTVCYLDDDYMATFARETEKFTAEVGLRPRSFTVHGLGRHRLDVRVRFGREILGRLEEFGYKHCDLHYSVRAYDYIIQDCHLKNEERPFHILEDFLKLPPFFRKGRNYLILTHPTHWSSSSDS